MGKLEDFLKDIGLFFEGALDLKGKSIGMLQSDIHNTDDEFLILCFADLLGIDIPTSYYALELLPYLEDELEGWQFRMHESKSVWAKKGGQLDMDP